MNANQNSISLAGGESQSAAVGLWIGNTRVKMTQYTKNAIKAVACTEFEHHVWVHAVVLSWEWVLSGLEVMYTT